MTCSFPSKTYLKNHAVSTQKNPWKIPDNADDIFLSPYETFTLWSHESWLCTCSVFIFCQSFSNFTVFQLLEFAHIHFSQQLSALGKTIDKVFKYDSFKEIRSKPFITKFQTKFFLLIYFSSSFVYKTRSFIILVFTCISVYSILIYLNINTSTVLCLFFRYHISFFVIACSRMKRQIKETLDVEQFLLF